MLIQSVIWGLREARYCPKFYEVYGIEEKESFVVVTGGSDGIGFSIVNMLAARGFNICIIARNQAKMDEKIAEVRKKYPQIKYMTIVGDFAKMKTMKDYREQIANKLKDIDIAMLFLNAGVGQMGRL